MTWAPAATTNPRTFLIRLTATDRAGNQIAYGATNAFVGRAPKGVVVRIQGIDAAFGQPSFAPGQTARITVVDRRAGADLPRVPRRAGTGRHLRGQPARGRRHRRAARRRSTGRRGRASRTRSRSSSRTSRAASTTSSSAAPTAASATRRSSCGRRRSATTSRVLVVLPTNTWQAYNFQDVDGNGYGDTWYAGPPNSTVKLSRTYIARGVPPRFYRYDLPFLHWLYWSGKNAEFISDSDFDLIGSATTSHARTTSIVFEGHEEYVDLARVRRRPALPRPRRQPDVPLGEQLLLEGRQEGADAAQDRQVARRRAARGGADRRRVPRERRRPAPGALHRPGLRRPRRGCGTAPGSPTDRPSASSSAATGSRSTRRPRSRRRARSSSRRSPTSSARASPRR